MPAELANADLECRPRAQRRLVEEHRDVASVEHVGRRRVPSQRTIRFQLRGELQAALEVGRIEVEHRQKIFARSGLRRWAHRHLPFVRSAALRALGSTSGNRR